MGEGMVSMAKQLTSWVSWGRYPEVSRELACPWETYPPRAPGDPEGRQGCGRCPSDLSALLKATLLAYPKRATSF